MTGAKLTRCLPVPGALQIFILGQKLGGVYHRTAFSLGKGLSFYFLNCPVALNDRSGFHEEEIVTDKVIEQVLTMMLIMAVGFVLRKRHVWSNEVNRRMTDILINVTMPFLILYSFNLKFSTQMMASAGTILVFSLIIHALLILCCQLWYCRFKSPVKQILHFSTVFSNCGFIGYPLAQALFGSVGVFYTSIFLIPYNFLVFSYGIVLFTGKVSLRGIAKNLFNLPLLATMLGIAIFVFSIRLPLFVQQTLSSVGNMTTPLSMFIIGSMLADVHPKEVFSGADVYYLSFIKLIVAPLSCYAALCKFVDDPVVLHLLVLMVAMPTATLVGIFAEKYDSNRNTASRCAFITTALSMITIPAIIAAI